MRTMLKIETGSENLEVELKMVDGKQIVELELAQLLALVDGKKPAAKTPKAPKPAKKPASKAKARKDAASVETAAEEPALKPAGAKRGRKPKSAFSGVSPFGSKDN